MYSLGEPVSRTARELRVEATQDDAIFVDGPVHLGVEGSSILSGNTPGGNPIQRYTRC